MAEASVEPFNQEMANHWGYKKIEHTFIASLLGILADHL